MTLYQLALILFAGSIPVVAVIVGAKLVVSAYRGFRSAHFIRAVFYVVAITALASAVAAVAVVWFGYAVAHSRKDVWTDLRVVLVTGLPFYGASFALWRLATFRPERRSDGSLT